MKRLLLASVAKDDAVACRTQARREVGARSAVDARCAVAGVHWILCANKMGAGQVAAQPL